jgi:hypothetical protein
MSYEPEDTYDVYDETGRKARKPHVCHACRESIKTGHRYARVFIVYEGLERTIIRCLRCQKMHEALRKRGLKSGLWPDEKLNCGEEYREHWGEDPPPELLKLAFITQDEAQELIAAEEARRG